MLFSPDRVGVLCFVFYFVAEEKGVSKFAPYIVCSVQTRKEICGEHRVQTHTDLISFAAVFRDVTQRSPPPSPIPKERLRTRLALTLKARTRLKHVTPFVSRVIRASYIRNGPFNSAST